MFNHIMIPVDLHMPPEVSKAMDVAAEMAKFMGARITIVSVTGTGMTDAPHTPETIKEALATVSEALHEKSGAAVEIHNITSHDIPVEVDSDLVRAAEEIDADLIIIGTHAPRITDYVMSSHAGYLAKHATVSVFVVR
ncbi:universal stress protein UspA [Ruegeria marisrubri]|uniref:Universal stress protein UspA n=1 Tax=Ruegeria marisrubri TaxID=1685379 RepID=A0A0X3UH61_9RHOB|nr:universal stress protein [Ruegeria marisrubri]KUJ85110.1 universal stress protein UspA [Ruegeria marisrubri]